MEAQARPAPRAIRVACYRAAGLEGVTLQIFVIVASAVLGWLGGVVLSRGLRTGRFAARGGVVTRTDRPQTFYAIVALYALALAVLVLATLIAAVSLAGG